METVLIRDGELSEFSLNFCNLTRDWLDDVLSSKKLNLKDVFIMTVNRNKEFNIIKKEG